MHPALFEIPRVESAQTIDEYYYRQSSVQIGAQTERQSRFRSSTPRSSLVRDPIRIGFARRFSCRGYEGKVVVKRMGVLRTEGDLEVSRDARRSPGCRRKGDLRRDTRVVIGRMRTSVSIRSQLFDRIWNLRRSTGPKRIRSRASLELRLDLGKNTPSTVPRNLTAGPVKMLTRLRNLYGGRESNYDLEGSRHLCLSRDLATVGSDSVAAAPDR